mgnify:CR=1 FL=1
MMFWPTVLLRFWASVAQPAFTDLGLPLPTLSCDLAYECTYVEGPDSTAYVDGETEA